MVFRELLDLHGAGQFVKQYDYYYYFFFPKVITSECTYFESLQIDRQLNK